MDFGDCRMDNHDTLKEVYAQITSIFKDFGLVMEHTKTELFNFANSTCNKNLPNPSINLGVAPFTRESSFTSIFIPLRLTPEQKCLLYISCIQPIAIFGLCCWYKPGTRAFKTNLKMLRLTHNQGLRWITGTFRTSPMGAMTAVAGLMPLHLTLKKLFERLVICINMLHPHHPRLCKGLTLHPNTLEQKSKTIRKVIKSPLDSVIDNPSSEILDPLSEHIKPGYRLVDRHLDKVKFVLMPKNREDRAKYHNNLNLAPAKELNALHLLIVKTTKNSTEITEVGTEINKDNNIYDSEIEAVVDDDELHGGCLNDDESLPVKEYKGTMEDHVPLIPASSNLYTRNPETSIPPDRNEAHAADQCTWLS
ncbi:hypothetical protein AGABI2DRAFT_122514 [Agaricus bisporus var. bisporus H97]|uniref:hypothetical protein n=1 Tax=Agaricus bisporus var. bisporus (strain H97 / ATCC MYA-4626 / FGSC 10389) TaxID=936046 RepID=UPI00029F6747|nr:hypothetical protein AGABI2DRAFT_122514 [Agaricus bisporus var. bisporus H97]EKV42948.1 hypothetical protein AGABI2DRAFT_122514 [Agaricus bisporus var. bisporus H97]